MLPMNVSGSREQTGETRLLGKYLLMPMSGREGRMYYTSGDPLRLRPHDDRHLNTASEISRDHGFVLPPALARVRVT